MFTISGLNVWNGTLFRSLRRGICRGVLAMSPVLIGTACSPASDDTDTEETLTEPALRPLPVGRIRAEGWLRRQLRIQAGGLTGHLDEFWPDVQDSGWIGGGAEGWERFPYWLDGLVPLAYVLEDPVLMEKVRSSVDYVVEHQREDGWLGPEQSPGDRYKPRDPWPVFVMVKALIQYQEATGDPRVVPVLQKFYQRLALELKERPLFDWNRMRWQDGVLGIHWLYERTRQPWLLELAATLHRQGFDWKGHFEDFRFQTRAARWEHESHVVNNAMGVKAPAVWYRQTGDPTDLSAASGALVQLDRFHGQVSGLFSGDECFAGKMPSQGTETCAVVEFLYSLEILASISADPAVGDRLERVAFNALPAPFKPDMWARQYVQQVNQPVVRISEKRIYTTNGKNANLFGLETNYGCCTANMHQGWPKYASSLWGSTADDGLAALSYAPCRVETAIREVPVRVEVNTDYPFSDRVELRVSTDRDVRFPLKLRVPGWAVNPTLNMDGETTRIEPSSYHVLERLWNGTTTVTLHFPMTVRAERRFNESVSLSRGPLVFSLAVGEDWRRVAGELPHADWEVHPTTPWNYALDLDLADPDGSVNLWIGETGENPFESSQTPLKLFVKGRRLPSWTIETNAAAPPPESPVQSDQPLETLELIPFGAAKLRITEFPWILVESKEE